MSNSHVGLCQNSGTVVVNCVHGEPVKIEIFTKLDSQDCLILFVWVHRVIFELWFDSQDYTRPHCSGPQYTLFQVDPVLPGDKKNIRDYCWGSVRFWKCILIWWVSKCNKHPQKGENYPCLLLYTFKDVFLSLLNDLLTATN